jgi:hypothetical protein
MREEMFNSIMYAAVRLHEVNGTTPGRWSSDEAYLEYMDRLKGRYDEWCKPGGEDDKDLDREDT